ncbi:hypothetical protein LDENG_00179030, partial [Lucifuga dentata]
ITIITQLNKHRDNYSSFIKLSFLYQCNSDEEEESGKLNVMLMSLTVISCLPVPVRGLFSENHRNTMTILRETGNLLNK